MGTGRWTRGLSGVRVPVYSGEVWCPKEVDGLERGIDAVNLLTLMLSGHTDLVLAHFQKLQSLFEDIFEESDSFPANPTAGDAGSSKYFSGTSNDGDHPLLASATIEKITRYVSRAQGSKRRSASDTEGLEGDVGTMRRVLKLLERSMRQAERVEVFPEDRKPSSSVKDEKNAGTGKGRKKGGKKSKSPVETQDSKQTGTPEISDIGLDQARIELLEEALSALQNRALAAECCLVLLDSGRVSKQVGPSSFSFQC